MSQYTFPYIYIYIHTSLYNWLSISVYIYLRLRLVIRNTYLGFVKSPIYFLLFLSYDPSGFEMGLAKDSKLGFLTAAGPCPDSPTQLRVGESHVMTLIHNTIGLHDRDSTNNYMGVESTYFVASPRRVWNESERPLPGQIHTYIHT